MEETDFSQIITRGNANIILGQVLWRGRSDCSHDCWCPQTSRMPVTCLVGEPLCQLLWLVFTKSLNLPPSQEDSPLTSPAGSAWKLTTPGRPWPIAGWGGSTGAPYVCLKAGLTTQFSLPSRASPKIDQHRHIQYSVLLPRYSLVHTQLHTHFYGQWKMCYYIDLLPFNVY